MNIEIWTDGTCRGNGVVENAISGIGIVLLIPGKEPIYAREKLWFEPNTNNEAEIYAIIQGINLLYDNYKIENGFGVDTVTIYSDSAYAINGITSWIYSWRANGWINSKKEPVKNKELWQELDNLLENLKLNFNVEFKKVRGHCGIEWNEKCDKLANEAMDER